MAAEVSARAKARAALHPNLVQMYAKRVATLREALHATDREEMLEATGAPIDKIVIPLPDDPSTNQPGSNGPATSWLGFGPAGRTPPRAKLPSARAPQP
jgi:hypothetical protein